MRTPILAKFPSTLGFYPEAGVSLTLCDVRTLWGWHHDMSENHLARNQIGSSLRMTALGAASDRELSIWNVLLNRREHPTEAFTIALWVWHKILPRLFAKNDPIRSTWYPSRHQHHQEKTLPSTAALCWGSHLKLGNVRLEGLGDGNNPYCGASHDCQVILSGR